MTQTQSCLNTAKLPCFLNKSLQDFKGTVGAFKMQNPFQVLKAEKQGASYWLQVKVVGENKYGEDKERG